MDYNPDIPTTGGDNYSTMYIVIGILCLLCCCIISSVLGSFLYYYYRNSSSLSLAGSWDGYYTNGTKSTYVWAITQPNATTINITETAGGGSTTGTATISGYNIDGGTTFGKGTISTNVTKISWANGTSWIKSS